MSPDQPAIHPLQRVAGVAESALSNAAAALLPDTPVPAPWETTADLVAWVHRSAPGARRLLAPALARRPALPLTGAAFVRYGESPVGPYAELLATPVLLLEAPMPAASVPFIAVDSIPSVLGGRAHWALPKALARFSFGPGQAQAVGTGWRVDARVDVRRRSLPLALTLHVRQAWPDGSTARIDVCVRGRVRLGRVALHVEGPTLPRWLAPGPHVAVIVQQARLTIAAAR